MTRFSNSPFQGELDVVATLADDAYEATLVEARKRDELTKVLRSALKRGVTIDELSEASSLPVEEIRRRCERELVFGDDLEAVAGLV